MGPSIAGIVLSVADRTALLQRAVAIANRLQRSYGKSLSQTGGAIVDLTGAKTTDHDSKAGVLERLNDRVVAATHAFARMSFQVEWQPPSWTVKGRPLNNEQGRKSRFVGYDGSTNVSVESLVLQ